VIFFQFKAITIITYTMSEKLLLVQVQLLLKNSERRLSKLYN